MTDKNFVGYILPPALSSSDDDYNDDDNDLDLCVTESIWNRKLREVCKQTQNEKCVEDHKASCSKADNIVLNNKIICPLVASDMSENIHTAYSISHVKHDIDKSENSDLLKNKDISVTKDKTDNTSGVILISDSSDVELDDAKIEESESSSNKKNKTYKPISDGKWRKQPVPKRIITHNKNNVSTSLSDNSSCNLSKGVSCSEDVDSFLDDYIESDEEENNIQESNTNQQDIVVENKGPEFSDDEIFINNFHASHNKQGTSNENSVSSSEVDLNFREVLLKKRSKSMEKKRKKSSLSDMLNEKHSNDSVVKCKKYTGYVVEESEDVTQGTCPSTSDMVSNPLFSWKLKTRTENPVVSQTENIKVHNDRQKIYVKSPLKQAVNNQTFPKDLEGSAEAGISRIKKCKSSNTIDGSRNQSNDYKEHQESRNTTLIKLHDVTVSNEEISRVLEIFPGADRDDIVSRIKLLKSESSDNVLERVIDDIFSCPFTKEVQSPSVRPSSVGEEPDILQALGVNVIGRASAGSESSSSTTGVTETSKSHGKLSKSALFSRKGKIPMKKNNPEFSTSTESPEISQDMDMTGPEMDVQSDSTIKEVQLLPPQPQKQPPPPPPPVVTCDSCKSESIDDKVVQCGNCHIICNTCLEKQVKSVLSPDSKVVLITCCVDSCVGVVPNTDSLKIFSSGYSDWIGTKFCVEGQAKRVLPSIIMDLLEEKLDKEVLDSVKNMGDSLICPVCDLPLTADPWLKEIECPNCKQKSCRFCKGLWENVDHTDCTTYSTQLHDTCVSSTLDVPFYWSPMPENGNKDYITVVVEKDTPEFSHVNSLFRSSMNNTKVVSIRRIQNLRLWQKFKLTKKHMTDDFGSDKLNEKQLFHGTNYTAVDAICKECFDWRMSGENAGVAYGQGTYFAKRASYSDRYCTSTPATLPTQSGQESLSSFFINPPSHIGVSSGSSNQTQGSFTQAVNSNPLGFQSNQSFTFGTQNVSQSGVLGVGNQSNSYQHTGFNFGNQSNTYQQTGFTFGVQGPTTGNSQQSGYTFGNPSNSQQQLGFTIGNQSTSNQLVHPKSGFKAVNVTGYTTALQTNVQKSSRGFGQVSNHNVSGFISFGPSHSSSHSNQNVTITDFMQPNKRYMFVARVLVGRVCNGSSKIRKPPLDLNDSKMRPFNSCVDNVNSPSIFVIFDISQCYPEYIIEY